MVVANSTSTIKLANEQMTKASRQADRQIDRREEESREQRQRPAPNDIYLQIKSELFPFRFQWNEHTDKYAYFEANRCNLTEMSNHSDDAESDVNFKDYPPFLSLSLLLGIALATFLIDSLSNEYSRRQTQYYRTSRLHNGAKQTQSHVFVCCVSSSNQQRINSS